MWNSTVGLVNGKHRYLTAETFGFKVNSNGQTLKKRQQWTIEPFSEPFVGQPENQISSTASIGSQGQNSDPYDPYISTLNSAGHCSSLNSVKSSSNGSATSDPDGCGEDHENVAIKSHLNKYLAVDSFGNVTCDSDEKTDNARFTITICSMSQGRSKEEQIFWAFKNVERGYFLGASEDGNVCCNAKMPKSRAELWLLHLIPARGSSFFALKSLGRKRFARVVDANGSPNGISAATSTATTTTQVQLDATTSWGSETLFQFKFHEGGLYSLLTSDCRYLTNDGRCITWKPTGDLNNGSQSTPKSVNSAICSTAATNQLPPQECLFTLEYHSGFLAFRDSFSHYLAATGRTSLLRSRSAGVSRDELFVFESAPIQVSLKATYNNRWVSIKQGVDLSANQLEANTTETFQMTYHQDTTNWSIMTHNCDYWTISQHTNTICICRPEQYDAMGVGQFRVTWSDSEATCSLRYVDANNQERWIAARKSGQLYIASNDSQTPVKFIMRFQNRRLLNLRPVDGNGFVGLKSGGQSVCRQLEATKTGPDSIAIEYSELLSSQVLSNELSLAESVANKYNLRDTKKLKPVSDECKNQRQTRENDAGNNNHIDSSPNGFYNNDNNYKEMDNLIDANNNCGEVENKMLNVGLVETEPIASVASIISSFSNAKLSDNNISKQQQQQQLLLQNQVSNRVSKLASSFDTASQPQVSPTSCVDSSQQNSSTISNDNHSQLVSNLENNGDQLIMSNAKLSTSERLAQFECCYLKVLQNNRYLVVGDKDQSIVCDAVNRACAQPWIIELRSHNCIAIRASDDHAYMQLGTNGTISLSRCKPHEASLWEF